MLEKAIIEHNMLATGRIYDNIRVSELANILLIDERRAEKVCFTSANTFVQVLLMSVGLFRLLLL